MDIPVDVMKFRTALASDLEKIYMWLFKMDLNVIGDFSKVCAFLKNNIRAKTHPDKETRPTFWGYELDNFIIKFNKNPRNIGPTNALSLELLFEIHVVADYDNLHCIKDPFEYLTFNIVIIGRNGSKEYINSWHLDRHLGGDTDEAHPIYHMHYGGAKLNDYDLGDSLLLDAPRLVHYPMDFVLGIDFVLSNFFPHEWNKLLRETDYPSIIEKYQKYFMKPFSYALTSHWNKNLGMDIEWSADNVCPTLR